MVFTRKGGDFHGRAVSFREDPLVKAFFLEPAFQGLSFPIFLHQAAIRYQLTDRHGSSNVVRLGRQIRASGARRKPPWKWLGGELLVSSLSLGPP